MNSNPWKRKVKTGILIVFVMLIGIFAAGSIKFYMLPKLEEGSKSNESAYIQEEELDKIQAEKLAELSENEGLYAEDSIVLADTDKEQAEAAAEALGAKLRYKNGYAVLYLPENLTIEQIYEDDDYCSYLSGMSPDYYVKTSALDARNKELVSKRPSYNVNDTEYKNQSYLDYINMQDAWGTSRGNSVTVAVIDTGIDTDNPEFSGRISDRSYNASDDKVVSDYGMSVIEDEQGHGTAVAGVMAAMMNNDEGITGVAPEAEILVIKCECDESGTFTRGSDLVFGLAYAIEQDADVVNMSFETEVNIFEKYTKLAVDSDIICVAAAGNKGTSMPAYPAADKNVIGVGAMDTGDWSLASYSNYGDNSDVVAPGTVYTTTLNGGYKYETGTSLSSPIAAASAALYLSVYPHTEFDEMLELFKAASTDLGSLGEDWYFGFGNLDLHAFLCEEKGTITYNMLTDELDNEAQVFVKGHTVQYMPEPERENVVFDGWYYDMECTDEVEYYEDVFDADTTLYAGWINEDEGSAYIYTDLPDGTVEIRSYTGKRRYLTVPETIEGKTVSSIGEGAFSDNSRIRTVTLPDTLKNIGLRAFYNCTSLRSIDIPDKVEGIGNEAFYGCVCLAEVGIPAKGALIQIGDYAFSQCGIAAIDIPEKLNSLGMGVFYGSTSLGTVRVDAGNASFTVINDALYDKAGSTLVYYPAAKSGGYSVDAATKNIGTAAFAYSRKSEIILPNGLKTIGSNAFTAGQIKKISIPESVTALGEKLFMCCTGLSEVMFEGNSSITEIPAAAFTNCFMLSDITVPSGVMKLGAGCFQASGLESIHFKENSRLKAIGEYAFNSTPIKTIDIPSEVDTIESGAFLCSSQLFSVNFRPDSSIKDIGSETFAYCGSLSSIDFPDSLAGVGVRAFFESGLVNVSIGKGLCSIGDGAFASCHELSEFTVDDANSVYASYGGVLYNAEKTELVMYPAAKEGSYMLADETRLIRPYAFAGAESLTDVIYDNNLSEIGEYAFSNCISLGTPSLPQSLETIGSNSFEYCASMNTELVIPKNVINVGRHAFFDDYALSNIRIEAESAMSRLGYGAFAYCGIKDFTIPGSVQTIGQEAFAGCRDLLTVTFEADSRLTNLPAWAFEGADELRQVTFEENSALNLIEARAFQGLSKLAKVDLKYCTNLTKIGNYAFLQCKSLSGITFPEAVDEIGRYAFQGCALMSRADIPKAVSFIGRYAFSGTGGINVYFKASVMPVSLEENWDYDVAGYYMGVTDVVTNGDWTYALTEEGSASVISYNGNDESVTLDRLDGHEVISIGGKAFKDNHTLKSISLPDTLTGIYQEAFSGTSSLGSISVPDGVVIIDNEAFKGSAVRSVSFGKGSRLASLGRYAFAETVNLTDITIPDGVDKIKDYAFYKSGIKNISFGTNPSITAIGRYAFSQSAITDIVLPDKVETIDYYAFAQAENLENVTFDTGTALSIYGNAFYRSGLKGSLAIPANVNYIGELCFTGCKKLSDIDVDAGNEKYSSADGVLLDKEGKKLITCPAGKTGSYDIASTVTTLAFGAFEDSGLERIDIAAESLLNTIGYRAFYGCKNLMSINIPRSVQSIDNYAFAECESLADVSVQTDGQLGGIYKGAFYNCRNLKSIAIPDAVQEISEYAFYGCSVLADVPVAETSHLKGIYDHAFEYSGIKSFVMPAELSEIGEYAFRGAGLDTLVCNESVNSIGRYAFADCGLADTSELIIPSSVEFLGNGALKGADNISRLTIPFLGEYEGDESSDAMCNLFGVSRGINLINKFDDIIVLGGEVVPCAAFREINVININLSCTTKIIRDSAFSWSGLSHINLPLDLKIIEQYTFENTNLVSISIPDSVEEIQRSAFYDSGRLKYVQLPASLKYIGDSAFACTGLSGKMMISDKILSIGYGAFSGCSELEVIEVSDDNKNYASLDGILYDKNYTELISAPGKIKGKVILPDKVKRIDTYAFWRCSLLEEIEFNDGLYEVGIRAFEDCDSLKSIEIPDSVKQLDAGIFTSCDNLQDVVIGDGVNIIPNSLLYSCSSLKNLALGDCIKEIEEYAFLGCYYLNGVYIPKSVEKISGSAFSGCENISYIEVDKENENFCSIDGILYNKSCDEIIVVPKKVSGEIQIPDGIKTITDGAFVSCVNIEKIILPESVEYIGRDAFRYCYNLADIEVGKSITHIGISAFEETAYWQDKSNWEEGVLYLGNYVIDTDVSNTPETLYVKNGTTLIGEEAMSANGRTGIATLRKVVLPDSLEYINDFGFEYNKDLYAVRLGEKIKYIGSGAFSGCDALKTLELNNISRIDNATFVSCTNLEILNINTEWSEDEFWINSCNNLQIIASPYSSVSLGTLLQNYLLPSTIIITSTDDMDTNFLYGLEYSGKNHNVFCYVNEGDWPDGWNHGAKVYYKGEWQLAEFHVNGFLVQMTPVKTGEVLQAPATSLVNEYLPEGAVFKGWDIDGDGAVDNIPANPSEDIDAQAVIDIPISDISIDETLSVEKGYSADISVSYNPKKHNHSEKLLWNSSDTNTATVDENGKITGVSEGEAVITATLEEDDSVTAKCTVNVIPVNYGIKLSETYGEMNVGDTYDLEPEFVLPEGDTDETLWESSRKDVATVAGGTITAIAPGDTEIKITHGEYTASYMLTVKAPLTGLSINETQADLNVGDTKQLEVTYEPADTTDDKEVFWFSTKPSVARVDSSGLVTAVGPGEADITGVVGSFRVTCHVTVKAPLKWIVLNTTTGTMRIDRTKQLEVIYEPANTTDDISVEWSSSEPFVADVDDTGLVTAKKAGTAVITAKVGIHEATYTVTVVGIKDESTGVIVTNSDDSQMDDDTSLDIEELDDEYLKRKYGSAWELFKHLIEEMLKAHRGHIPIMQMYDISLSNGQGTQIQPDIPVDVEIPVPEEAVKEGAVIYRLEEDGTITDMDAFYDEEVGRYQFEAEHFSVYVLGSRSIKTYVDSITLNETAVELCPGHTFELAAEVLPQDAEDTSVKWTSKNEQTAMVSQSGVVTALNEGETVIRAEASDEGGAYAECTVKVGHDYKGTVTEPTCTERGYTTYRCSKCGDSYVDDKSYTDAKGHSMEETPHKDATCTEDGNEAYWRCTECNKYFSDSEGNAETKLEDTVIHASGHDYKGTVTEPTCTERGYTTYNCSKCGDSYVDDKSYTDAKGHSMEETPYKEATCTEDGNEAYWHCTECNKYFSDSEGNAETNLEDAVIHATGHDYKGIVTEPTCTERGYTTYNCSKCGDSYVDDKSYTDAKGHSYGEWQEVQSPGCMDPGSKKRECTVCGYTETEGIDAAGHIWKTEYTVDREPTCTEEGSRSIHCSVCDAIKDSENIPAKGHTFGQWTVSADGKQESRTCTECGYAEARSVSTVTPPESDKDKNPQETGKSDAGTVNNIPQPGNVFVLGSIKYTIISSDPQNMSVEFTEAEEGQTSIMIPDTIQIDGISYKVTSIAAKAFKGNKKLKKVTIGKNIVSIGKKAFYNCKKLKKVKILSANARIGKKAFYGINAGAKIQVPKKNLAAYKKALKKSKIKSGVKIKK